MNIVTVNGEMFISPSREFLLEQGYDEKSIKEILTEYKWVLIREKRNELVKEVDWTQGTDVDLDKTKQLEFMAYRQELRNLPQTYDDPDDVVWPDKPKIV